MAEILDGKEVAARLTEELRMRAENLKSRGVVPKLAIVRVGERVSDVKYEQSAAKKCATIGIEVELFHLGGEASQEELIASIEAVNRDGSIHGCLIFRPFPEGFDDALIRSKLDPDKDVDGITNGSLSGVFTGTRTGYTPCTADACMRILEHYGYDLEGKNVVVIGASLVVGRPLALMFLTREATVSLCHIKTRDVKRYCDNADIIVSAAGHAGLVKRNMVKPGQTVLDVGINVNKEGKLCGDVDFDAAAEIVDAITPVPGGVGSVTTSVLAMHTIEAAEAAWAPKN
ncbi:bifunctional 5,10-methylenetetrahydrofolate dehydrogenase/5,10-methenyltetrahydrofolate cyclohydrolase [[Clostridium] symbiosum]|uniref:bifunctional 5,10-methylenetetrahydrofolate dehydrogenase/5,10-methenyltetrahydrofolate cyclohydrolase n=1 Tax=Clostridium symbiosum TaxID=1512 RepID=UPI001D08A576|nr:bifunctional 5,10-methylenetetrahydrofolate dehydrogenase/5,10-methenyltetrahydrofolate cyclohydrolase [[Clostridium] symbiosum]MCB6607543.1 bifunctional 5,10-methylenetetrahydrofolate dehydrogenase/5,10-methenyltetrahydrofolate cyclohydrolase [[Clostridium] symbiosum]MCB6930711.1 bifunctional 5,10-methylenetetrahydrofolate dehydrogenase/5,10-methenyltetrahydrofolate cyclohydrolase [[Clostridium] symbiosum]